MAVRVSTLFVLALLSALPSARAEDGEPVTPPEPNPQRSAPGDSTTGPWGAEEIETAETECKALLDGMTVDYEMLPPIKEGECGAPAPILVRSIGEPKVVIEPAATITCALAASLNRWLRERVQPEAGVQFGARVTKLRNIASYDCRHRNGDAIAPISEHALVNALDIAAFVLESGEEIAVLKDWPHDNSEAPPPPHPSPARQPEVTGGIPLPQPKPPIPVARVKSFKTTAELSTSRLPASAPPEGKPLSARKADFLKRVHDEACEEFRTVLGPDADEAHQSHFHLDMRVRRSGLHLCQ